MKPILRVLAILMTGALLTGCASRRPAVSQSTPNVVFIITDDLGWGDLSCYGAKQIRTPNLDRMASEGLLFTQAYAPASTCTPTRFALMTGEYAWRRPPQQTGILDGDAPLAIRPDQLTWPEIMRKAGYTTGLVGKWHLGLGDGKTAVDFNRDILPGPLEVGFDSAFFIPATVDRVPCVFIEDHRVFNLDPSDPIRVSYRGPVGDEPAGRDRPDQLKFGADGQHSDAIINGISRIGYMTGGTSARWVDEEIADTITSRAVRFMEENRDRPFFLYFATHDPHVPRAPHPRFRGRSGCGVRGDTVIEIDWSVGKILDALDRLELSDRTLVIFTSDNGPVLFDGYYDGAAKDQNGHQPAGGLRGWKYLVFEGSCRVPMIVRWPGQVPPGRTDRLFSLVDLPATFATLTGQDIPPGQAPDSLSLPGVLLGRDDGTQRDHVVMQGISGGIAIRQGPWKYVAPNAEGEPSGMGRGADPRDTRFVESSIYTPLLFNLEQDPAEERNVADSHPDKVRQLANELQSIQNRAGTP